MQDGIYQRTFCHISYVYSMSKNQYINAVLMPRTYVYAPIVCGDRWAVVRITITSGPVFFSVVPSSAAAGQKRSKMHLAMVHLNQGQIEFYAWINICVTDYK